MDAVRAFNNELSSLYETKPPVSRAKMGAVTRAAIKAIKFYKHVVQSVEKFVLKCKPEYKIPGLYVIDSVVRQSRHQFGGEKDVFGPRFTKNIVNTFQSLLKCPADDRSRVIRVLNLWQKNTVFPMEVIQALLDMASDPSNLDSVAAAQRVTDNVVLAHQRSHGKLPSVGSAPGDGSAPGSGGALVPAAGPAPANGGSVPNSGPEESLMAQQSDIVNTVTKLLQQTGDGNTMTSGQDVQLQQLQLLQQQLMMHTELMSHKPQQTTAVIDNNLLAQIKLLTDQLLSKAEPPAASAGLPPPPPPPLPTMAQNVPPDMHVAGVGFVPIGEPRDAGGLLPPIMGHERPEDQNSAPPPMGAPPRDMPKPAEPLFNKKLLEFDYGDSDDSDMDQSQNEMDVQQQQHPHHQHHHQHLQQQQQQLPGDVHKLLNDPTMMQHIHNVSALKSDQLRPDMPDPEALRKQHLEQQQEQFNKEIEQTQYSGYNQDQDVIVVEEQEERDYDRDRRRSRHSRDRSRSPKRRRHSRSRSRERRRSRDRHRRSRSRDYDRERQREKDRERKKKGLPPTKDKYISLCSTTLWFGHLAKYTTEDELRSAIESYGTVESIKMVPPRGCAFVNMTWRKEAAKALDRMKGLKLNSSALRVAWAPNMGVKESAFKDLWDVDLGVTYISWDKLPSDLSPLLDGAMIDEDTLPDHLKGTIVERSQQDRDGSSSENFGAASNNQSSGFGVQNQSIPSSQHLTLIPPPMMIPPPGSLPPPGIPIPPPGQLPLPGQIPLPGQSNPPQGLPPSLLPPPGGPVSSPLSLSIGLPRPVVASAAASLIGSMDGALSRPPILSLNSSASIILPGQQPGIPARPGLPPGPPFGPPPGLRPGMPPPGPGLHPFPGEEGKEWADDSMDEDMNLNDDEDSGLQGRGPGPLMGPPPPVMRMGLPGAPLLGHGLLPRGPHQDGPDGLLPPQIPPGLMGPVGLRLGPRGLPPLPLGNRFGSPAIRGMGPGGSPVRFVLGQRPNLVRPGGPFGLDNPRQALGDRQSSPPRGSLLRDGPGPGPSEPGHGPRGPGDMQVEVGAGPSIPINGRFPVGPGAPNFREPPPNFSGGAANNKSVEGSQEDDDDDKSPVYGEESSSPEYGDDFDDMDNPRSAAQDGNVCDGDSQSNPKNEPDRSSQGTSVNSGQTKSGRVSRWSDRTNDDTNSTFQDRLAGTNGLPSDTNTDTKPMPSHATQSVSEGISSG